ncbi:MAG: phosphotransferase [Candidatus Chisholmbacteria bacterium]|nr:phosphotransferase [Candidatus Chisholmbacteria bacterium]
MNLGKKYLSIIKHHYPSLKNYQLQIFDHGWDHVIIVANQKEAFRIPRGKAYQDKLPTEVRFLEQFAPRSPITVPQMQLHQYKNVVYAIYDFIPGVKFEKSIQRNFSTQNRLRIAALIGQFLTALHSFSVPKAKRIGLETMNQTFSYWQNRLTHIENTVFRLISIPEQRWIKNLFTRFSAIVNQTDAKFVVNHGDIAPEHIIVNPQGQTLAGIIDFGDISIGDPAYDFQLEHPFGSEFLHTVYAHYQLPRDDTFDTRRQFYEYSQPIRVLENSLNRHDSQLKVNQHLQELSTFINAQ